MPRLDDVLAAVSGLGLGLSLIVVIGAQNAFVLQQGLRGEYVTPVVVVCALSDLVLIGAGIAGLGALVTAAPAVLTAVRLAGVAFLVTYALLAARRAWRPRTLDPSDAAERRLAAPAVIGTCLALTWLNPHVYLDTMVLLGSVATSHGPQRWWFGAGAGLASILWFAALGYGARLLRPVFAKPVAWRILDAAIAVTMLFVAATLLHG